MLFIRKHCYFYRLILRAFASADKKFHIVTAINKAQCISWFVKVIYIKNVNRM